MGGGRSLRLAGPGNTGGATRQRAGSHRREAGMYPWRHLPSRQVVRMKQSLSALLIAGVLLLSTMAVAQVRIDVYGGDDALNRNVRNHIGTLEEKDLERPRRLNRRLRKLVTPAAEALGYYELRYALSIEDKTLHVKLTPGEPVRWAEPAIDIIGDAAQLKPVARRLQEAPIRAGEVINHGVFDQYKRDLQDICNEYGFLDSRYLKSELRIDLPSH